MAAILAGFALVAIHYTPSTDAAIELQRGLPAYWSDETGSNQFGVNASAVPALIKSGVLYTGATTNLAVYDGAVTNTLVIVNGICTGVQ